MSEEIEYCYRCHRKATHGELCRECFDRATSSLKPAQESLLVRAYADRLSMVTLEKDEVASAIGLERRRLVSTSRYVKGYGSKPKPDTPRLMYLTRAGRAHVERLSDDQRKKALGRRRVALPTIIEAKRLACELAFDVLERSQDSFLRNRARAVLERWSGEIEASND